MHVKRRQEEGNCSSLVLTWWTLCDPHLTGPQGLLWQGTDVALVLPEEVHALQQAGT